MLVCTICKRQFADGVAAKTVNCSGGGHILQEVISGSRNVDTGELADFYAPSRKELKEWAEQAKKLGYDID